MLNSIVSVPYHCPFIYLTLAYQHYASGINGTGSKFSTGVDTRSNEIYVDFISKYVTFLPIKKYNLFLSVAARLRFISHGLIHNR